MAFNVSPFLTSLIAYPLLGERVTSTHYVGLTLAFFGIAMMLLCGNTQPKPAEYTPSPIMYIALIGLPISAAIGGVAQRKVKNLNQNVMSVYMVVALFVIFLPLSLA